MSIKGSCGHVLDTDSMKGVYWLEGQNVAFGYLCKVCETFVRAVEAKSPIAARTKLAITCEIKVVKGKTDAVSENREREHS